jgi:hypothetical protein
MFTTIPNIIMKNRPDLMAGIRYWLPWLLLLVALAIGIHRYFEYRNAELDKRIEQLNK